MPQNIDIPYSGFSSVPSDHENKDGELALSMNLINEDGAMKPILKPALVLRLPSPDYYVIFIHKTSVFCHYIVASKEGGSSSKLWWVDEGLSNPSEEDLEEIYDFAEDIKTINSIGNTLMVVTETSMHYLLWKSNDNLYKYLGTHLPECVVHFGLTGEFVEGGTFEFHIDEYTDSKSDYWQGKDQTYSDASINTASDAILGALNRFVKEEATDKGRFVYPFFVRYAYRLYDGSLTMHSAPIFMACASGRMPRMYYGVYSISGIADRYGFGGFWLLTHKLWLTINSEIKNQIEDWSDIISSLDIFISAPIYTVNQGGKVTLPVNLSQSDYSRENTNDIFSITSLFDTQQHSPVNKKWMFLDIRDDYYNSPFVNNSYWYCNSHDFADEILPGFGDDILMQKIKDTSLFYFLKSYKFSELPLSSSQNIEVSGDYLASLTSREVMSDDYQSHDNIVPGLLHNYNARLHMADLKRDLFGGFNPRSLFQWAPSSPAIRINRIFVYVRSEAGVIVKGSIAPAIIGQINSETPLLWIFYPDANAYRAIIEVEVDSALKYYDVHLDSHPTLNGAYAFNGWDGLLQEEYITKEVPEESDPENSILNLEGKIYTSEVNNPFFFPLNNIVTVGTDRILGLSSAARPLSQGQFGQFPLYAFTSEGVWAIELSSTGTYAARQPITRDVVLGKESICPIDSAVLFATARGIMLLSGSQVTPVSDKIIGEEVFNVLSLPSLPAIIKAHAPETAHLIMGQENPDGTSFGYPNFFPGSLSDIRMIYDYRNQHIIAFLPQSVNWGPTRQPCYVFSLKSQQWGMIVIELSSTLNSYPDGMAMTPDGSLVNFSSGVENFPEQILVTRPFSMGNPYLLKTISAVMQRGMFRRGHIKSVLYGSRDLFSWHMVRSSSNHELRNFSGTPYKYFRLAIVCNLTTGESVHSASLLFDPRFNNKLR